ncbi:MAG: MFS transporter [Coriobacteriaceae bacterium]|nr:MFS transporter [Coriobacteriaceae bacterium]
MRGEEGSLAGEGKAATREDRGSAGEDRGSAGEGKAATREDRATTGEDKAATEKGIDIKRGPLVAALMTVVFLAAMESTITVLAAPVITRDLAGFDLMSLVFSAYLLASALTTPLFGHLADRYGRKRMLNAGIVIFLIGSTLCGMAWSMPVLIAFRAVQGVGVGAIFTLAYTIAGDAFPIASRAAVLGAMSSVWGLAGLLGPVAGGFLIEALSWHWVFFINLPFGAVALFVLGISLRERLDFGAGAAAASWKGVLTKQTAFINLIAFLACISMQGIDVYMALYLQDVLGFSAMVSGLALLPMCFSWFATSYAMGKLLLRVPGKTLLIASGLWQLVCAFLFLGLDARSSLFQAVLVTFLSGFGLGGVLTASTVVIQESVGYRKRGSAMGINSFVKSLGQTFGISVLGIALNFHLTSFFTERGFPGIVLGDLTLGLGTAGVDLPGAVPTDPALIASGIGEGINLLFLIMLMVTAVMVLVAALMPPVRLGVKGRESETNG